MLKVIEAIEFGKKHHKGQKRKGSGLPYITHPVAVSYLLAKYKVSRNLEELIIAAILHDLLEDSSVTFAMIQRKFGPLVASLVLELTNDPEQIAKLGKLEYQIRKLIGISSWALVIKLVDRLHNISDQPTDKMVQDTLLLLTALRENRKLSKTHERIIVDIEALCAERMQGKEAA